MKVAFSRPPNHAPPPRDKRGIMYVSCSADDLCSVYANPLETRVSIHTVVFAYQYGCVTIGASHHVHPMVGGWIKGSMIVHIFESHLWGLIARGSIAMVIISLSP